MDERNQIVAGLADSWEFSPSGDELTFNLHSGVRFQGCSAISHASQRVLNAADVKASFERLIRAHSPYGYIFDHVVGIDAFKAKRAPSVSGFIVNSSLQFTIKLQRPFLTMLPWLLAPAAYILPAELPEKYDFGKGSCGTGPFVLTSWDGTEAKFTANRAYRLKENGRSLPLAPHLSIRVIKDASVQLAAFRAGELDVLNVPLPLFHSLLNDDGSLKPDWSGFSYREVKLNNLQFIAFNMQSTGWGSTPDLRRRLSQALNRNEIVRGLYAGKARPATSIIPTGIAGFEK
jgi:peptide/nickel transport system substrate-binding protein